MTKKRILHCEFCFKTFTRPSALRPHRYTHTGEKPFACHVPGCGRRFTVISNLRRHYKVHERRQFQPVFATYGELSAFLFAYLSQQQQQPPGTSAASYPLSGVSGEGDGICEDSIQTNPATVPQLPLQPPHPPSIVTSSASSMSTIVPSIPSSNTSYPYTPMNNNGRSASVCFSPGSSTSSSAPSLVSTPIPPNHISQQRRGSHPTYPSYYHQRHHHNQVPPAPLSCNAPFLPETPPPGRVSGEPLNLVESVPLTAISSVSSIGSLSTAANSPPLPIIPSSAANKNNNNNSIQMDSSSNSSSFTPPSMSFQYAPHQHHHKATNVMSEKPMLDSEELMSWILSQQQQQQQQQPKHSDTPLYYNDSNNTTVYSNFYYSPQ